MLQRWTAVASALVFVSFVGVVISRSGVPSVGPDIADVEAVTDAGLTEPVEGGASPDATANPTAAAPQSPAPDAPGPSFEEVTVKPLPEDAPRTVSFGVVLVPYRGAQGAPADAPSKLDALERARALCAVALENFDEAVKKGAPGSVANAGRIPRGVLEPAVEYALFTLDKGAVRAEPLDTPRGFWIVRRIR